VVHKRNRPTVIWLGGSLVSIAPLMSGAGSDYGIAASERWIETQAVTVKVRLEPATSP